MSRFIEVGQRIVWRENRAGECLVKYSGGPWLHGGDQGMVIEYHPDPFGYDGEDYATVLLEAQDGRTQRIAIHPPPLVDGEGYALEHDGELLRDEDGQPWRPLPQSWRLLEVSDVVA